MMPSDEEPPAQIPRGAVESDRLQSSAPQTFTSRETRGLSPVTPLLATPSLHGIPHGYFWNDFQFTFKSSV
jgi:hypothetical protein